jgi:tyrosine-protein phosphatase SIW14
MPSAFAPTSAAVDDGTLFARAAVEARDEALQAAEEEIERMTADHDIVEHYAPPAAAAAGASRTASPLPDGASAVAAAAIQPVGSAPGSPAWLPMRRATVRRRPVAPQAPELDSPQLTVASEADMLALLGRGWSDGAGGGGPATLQEAIAAALAAAPPPPPPPHVSVDGAEYTMPEQFGVVEAGVYRSAYPTPAMFPFLDRLHLRTVINLLDRLPPEYEAYLASRGVAYVHCAVKGNKAHCEEMDRGKVRAALARILDAGSHPVLVHCRSGKHRTGALIGCLRMLQRWDLEAACNEYVDFCRHKQRSVDKQYIERFDPRTLAGMLPPRERWPAWLPDVAAFYRLL